MSEDAQDGIAIIGMAGRFPGSDTLDAFWQNLREGVNCIVSIPEDELKLTEEEKERLKKDPFYVQKAAAVKDADKFDAAFFGVYPKEAEAMDPQHRIILECSWEALEDAGYEPENYKGTIGVFAGCYMNTYILSSFRGTPDFIGSLADSFFGGSLLNEIGNDKDYLATRVSYKLNLRGPSMTIQTACSTSLVSIIQACIHLAGYQCDMALAGGASLRFPQGRGYIYEPDGMVAPDGVCRTFDARSKGTVFGNGAGMVLLKRLDDAIADGDDIYAVLKGWGMNNDGGAKVGYTTPSVEGQSEAIALAHAIAEIDPSTISYVEAHGTGTPLGDPIEIDGLTRAFRMGTDEKQFCAIGSIKTNIGHLDVASGVAGLMKTTLALKHKEIPPSLNFEQPNPNIDFENSPFFVNTALRPWEEGETPRRAGVSSFGVGGTNAHVVVEEAPVLDKPTNSRPHHVLTLSARSENALNELTDRWLTFLEQHPDTSLADAAYTMHLGRRTFNYSRVLTAENTDDAVDQLKRADATEVFTRKQLKRPTPVVFMFPGQGAQHVGMARDLYEHEPVFRQEMDRCNEILKPLLGFDLLEVLYPKNPQEEEAANRINQTMVAQPGIFAISYSLAKMWMAWGVEPEALIGHSVGEFTAACLAGVFSLEDGLNLVTQRGKLMQDLPAGSMMAVRLPHKEVIPRLNEALSIAAVNSPTLCVVSGPTEEIEALQVLLEADEVVCRMLHTSHAFHSAMMDPAVPPFAEVCQSIELHPPSLPIRSTVTGEMLTDEMATDPGYWAGHLRQTVNFASAVGAVLEEPHRAFLEVGPGRTLSTLSSQHPDRQPDHQILSSLPHAAKNTPATKSVMTALGRLWQAGVPVNWGQLHAGEDRHRVHLPTYPFERKRFWYDEDDAAASRQSYSGDGAPATTQSPSTPSSLAHHPLAREIVARQLELMRQQLNAWHDVNRR